MTILQIDIETYSSDDLTSCGVYRYVEAPDFEILLFAYAYDDDPVQVVDLATGEKLPDQVLQDLTNPEIIKTAFNANFERTCIAKHFDITCDPRQWRCTAVWAMTLGLPGSLEKVAEVLKLKAKKDTRGKNLIKYFSVPCKPTKSNGQRTRNHPHHDPEKWQQFKEYNRQDVVVEREIRRKLQRFPVPDHEWKLWALDQKINDRGVRLDPALFKAAIECDRQYTERLIAEAKEITGLENPNSDVQLKTWLRENGLETDSLAKEHMADLIEQAPDDEVRRVLEIRQELGKTSVDKYKKMDEVICQDERARGLLQFCGANRTWRWAGRLIQVQNLPQNKLEDLALAREVLRSEDFELLELLYGPPPFVLSQLIRTAFIPSPGCRFIVSDFSAIEARVVAWLADEKWVLNVFRDHGKIYEATAANMFKVPFETIVKGHPNYELRAKGKVATLACGYQGGPQALIAMGALKSGIPEEELPRLVQQWRDANPNIVRLWYDAEEAAISAVRQKTTVKLAHGVKYRYEAGILFADLPSGRSLAYVRPRIEPDPQFGKDGLVYDGMDQVKKKWKPQRTYGGKLVENLVQAIARDCLAESLKRLDKAGYDIVIHVHDEVVLNVPIGTGSVEEVAKIMSEPINWAPGLPLTADGFECEFYRKD
ncbi:DNA polymerase [Aeribacillus composti]|uniref:DNA polymerase n=1 Tax=Aeribacillus composti TaxID=1868734 RepID=UPI00119AA696|nr:DNA polymerase [Aeribacillus composti]TVZ81264.1 DNA polymerase [Aeribacillus composti]